MLDLNADGLFLVVIAGLLSITLPGAISVARDLCWGGMTIEAAKRAEIETPKASRGRGRIWGVPSTAD